jgi:hypothetical protein
VATLQHASADHGRANQAKEQHMADTKQGMEMFKRAADEAVTLQAKWVEQSFKTMDEYNALMKAGLKYWTDLQADARKLAGDLVG